MKLLGRVPFIRELAILARRFANAVLEDEDAAFESAAPPQDAPDTSEEPTREGPPAHWLADIAAKAPHLVQNGEFVAEAYSNSDVRIPSAQPKPRTQTPQSSSRAADSAAPRQVRSVIQQKGVPRRPAPRILDDRQSIALSQKELDSEKTSRTAARQDAGRSVLPNFRSQTGKNQPQRNEHTGFSELVPPPQKLQSAQARPHVAPPRSSNDEPTEKPAPSPKTTTVPGKPSVSTPVPEAVLNKHERLVSHLTPQPQKRQDKHSRAVFRASPPGPLPNSAASPLRGEGEISSMKTLIPPLHGTSHRDAKLERGLGGEVHDAGASTTTLPTTRPSNAPASDPRKDRHDSATPTAFPERDYWPAISPQEDSTAAHAPPLDLELFADRAARLDKEQRGDW